jgi:hypothetical protein
MQRSCCKRGSTENFFWTGKTRSSAGFGNWEVGRKIRTLVLEVNGSPKSPMLVIVGMILLLTWTFDYALHLAPSSLVNLLLLFASISFVLDFMRERENLRHPRPGWDAMPPKGWFANAVRRVRHKMNASSWETERPKAVPSMKLKATRAA